MHPGVSCVVSSDPLGDTCPYVPLGQLEVVGHLGIESTVGRMARGQQKEYEEVWGYHNLDLERREAARPTIVRRKFMDGTRPALV